MKLLSTRIKPTNRYLYFLVMVVLVSSVYLILKSLQPTLLRKISIEPGHSLFTKDNTTKRWKTYKVEEYQFQVSYPEEGWNLTEDPFFGEPIIPPLRPRHVVNLYSSRLFGQQPYRDQESVVFTIAVYDKLSAASLMQWLSATIPDLSKIKKGDIHNAFARAYARERGIVSYNEFEEEGMQASELGAVVLGGGTLSYIAYFTKNGLKYVYAIELSLPFHEKWAEPADSTYAELFKQIITTFEFAD